MKQRIALLTIFFYLCTFANPQRSQAVLPLVAVAAAEMGASIIPAAAATAGLASIGIGASWYYSSPSAPEVVRAIEGQVAGAADAIMCPGYLAADPLSVVTAASFPEAMSIMYARPAAVGATIGDIVDFTKGSAASLYTALKDYIASFSSAPIYNEPFFNTGDTFVYNDNIYQISTGTWVYLGTKWVSSLVTSYGVVEINTGFDSYDYYFGYYSGIPTLFRRNPTTQETWKIPLTLKDSTVVPLFTPEEGSVDYPAFAAGMASAPTAVKDDIKDVIPALPSSQIITTGANPASLATAQAAPTITAAEIASALRANSAEVAAAAAAAAAQIAAANPADAAAQIAAAQAAATAAQAAADAVTQDAAKEAEQPEAETFSPISATPFQEPYNPGEFDIPARFTTFLNNVKSSGLFSFSSAFFNSLPGGGSSVYTINGGATFGTHTIDLGNTLSGGLAVLKTILLACFGFLSIRAVIMKR